VIRWVPVFRDETKEPGMRHQLNESNKPFEELAEQSRAFTWEVDENALDG